MARILLSFDNVAAIENGEDFDLDAETAKKLVRVLRLTPGETFTGFDGRGREWECVLQNLNSFVGAARTAQKLGQMKIGFRLSGFDADGVLIKVDSLLHAALGAADMAEEEEYGGIFGIGGPCLLQQGFAARQIVARKGGGGLLQERLKVRQKKTAKLVT